MLDWDQKSFNESVATFKDKKLKHVSFVGNPFVEEVEAYRIWIISNNARLVDLDGDKVTAAEKRSRIKDPPAVVKDAKTTGEMEEYLGKKVTVKLFEQTAELLVCFDQPDRTLEVVSRVQDNLLKLVPIDPRGRIMFDYEEEDARDELELMDDEGKEGDQKSEHGTDLRPPEEIIEEYMQTLMLLVERQPAAAPRVLRIIVMSLSLENENLSQRALEQLLDLLEAGSVGEMVVETVMATLIPQLTDPKIPLRARDLLLRALHTLADEGEGIKEAMRPLGPTLAQWINDKEPSEAVLGVVASASKDKKTALELRDERVPRRAIALLQARETRKWPHSRRLQLLRIVQWTSINDKRASEEYSKANVHMDLLNEIGGAVSVPGQFSEAKSTWVAQLISTVDSLTTHSPATRDVALKSGYVDRLLRIVASQVNIRAQLLTAVLRSLADILMDCDTLMFKKITFGLGGVVPLLQYIQGRKYEQLAELVGEVDESGVVPLRLLRNKEMMTAIGAVVGVVKVYCLRANQEDPDAVEVSNKLDAAGREQVLFLAMEAPDDDLKVLVMECLLEVPIDNLQAAEVSNIVDIIANCDNLTVGRTEEILSHTFAILQKLAVDDGEEGMHFRRFHAATIHMALDLLVRNTGRDTRGNDSESEEKSALSIGAVGFLRASSFEWPEALELMQTRDAVDAMLQIMKNEEKYGRSDMPIWIERTAVGSQVSALMQCLMQLDIGGELAGRVLTRMAEVLEGRHTDEEIASADVMSYRDFSGTSAVLIKQRIAQHSLFVQLDGGNELMRYLLMHIKLSPPPTAVGSLGAHPGVGERAAARGRPLDGLDGREEDGAARHQGRGLRVPVHRALACAHDRHRRAERRRAGRGRGDFECGRRGREGRSRSELAGGESRRVGLPRAALAAALRHRDDQECGARADSGGRRPALPHMSGGRRDQWTMVPCPRGAQPAAHHARPLPAALDGDGGAADDGHPVRHDRHHAQVVPPDAAAQAGRRHSAGQVRGRSPHPLDEARGGAPHAERLRDVHGHVRNDDAHGLCRRQRGEPGLQGARAADADAGGRHARSDQVPALREFALVRRVAGGRR